MYLYHYRYTTLTLIHNKLIDQRTHNTVATFNSIPSQIFDPGQSAIILISSREMFLTGMLNAHAWSSNLTQNLGLASLPNTNQ